MELIEKKSAKTGRMLWCMLIFLIAEKIVQHVFIAFAFHCDLKGIRATVAPDPNLLLTLSLVIASLFALSLYGVIHRRRWAFNLATGLALVDIIGEFIAQGTIFITMTVSYIVALFLVWQLLLYRQRELLDA